MKYLCLLSKLLIFLNIFNFFDLIVTIIGINNYGFSVEGNSNIVFIVSNFGFIPLIIIKIVGVFLISLYYYKNIIYSVNKYKYKNIKFFYYYKYFSLFVLLYVNLLFIYIIYDWVIFLV